MSNPQTAEIQSILKLAKQGDPSAIAALINHSLNPRGITARVGWKNHCLGILLEALPIPDQEEMIAFVHQSLTQLQPESIRLVKVGGYQPGQSIPAWYEEIELEGRSVSRAELNYRTPSLTSWLNQGLDPSHGQQALSESGALLPHFSIAWQPDNAVAVKGDLSNPIDRQIPDRQIPELRFLRFGFQAEETALLPLSNIQQVLKVPVLEILPVPHLPDCVLGIYNWRGEMLWLVDLAQQMGFPSVLMNTDRLETMNAIVIHSDRQFLGMVVPRVCEIEAYSLPQLQPPSSAFPARLLSFMQSYISSSGSPVLNAKALIQDPLLQVHCPH